MTFPITQPNKNMVVAITCPKCGSPELNKETNLLLIRGLKVLEGGKWWSHCLVCSGYYMPDKKTLNPDYNPLDDSKSFWFPNS